IESRLRGSRGKEARQPSSGSRPRPLPMQRAAAVFRGPMFLRCGRRTINRECWPLKPLMLHCILLRGWGALRLIPSRFRETFPGRQRGSGDPGMSENAAFLLRLHRIADERALCDECTMRSIALFNLYRTRLYARLGIGSSNRPTTQAKALADHALADLR